MHRNKSVDTHAFAMVPRAEIPRSAFRMQKGIKTTFDAGYLIPIMVEEVLPGDTFNTHVTLFARLATPIFPIMDNMYLDTFFFFVPNRLVWNNWVKFMGEQDAPGDSISFSIPQVVSGAGGFLVGGIFDYLGCPTVGQVAAGMTVSVNALPARAYCLIYNKWFRDENLVTGFTVSLGDGPDLVGSFALPRRGKRHDYFTSALPWVQKGNTSVTLPLGTSATIRTSASQLVTGAQPALTARGVTAGGLPGAAQALNITAAGNVFWSTTAAGAFSQDIYPSNLYADLTTATAATINQIRQAFQIQRLLERDARGGTRYTEIVRSHFGVISPDARLQRPEYLGGSSTPIAINPVAQTSNTPVTGTPQGNLSAFGTGLSRTSWSQSFTEHGYIIGICSVRADYTYQQGLRKLWDRKTRYDFYFPVFAMLGEQAILNKEIYAVGSATGGIGAADQDMQVFGYQERWAEYRYMPSQITGLFRSTSAGTIDPWHLAQKFTALPTLGQAFIEENPPLSRVIAVGAGANGQQFIMDGFIDTKAVRPLPLYSVPGLVDHF